MSAGVSNGVSALEQNPVAFPARHPNTPVMPFATPTKKASFIDPTVQIIDGNSVVVSYQSYVAPYARLDASGLGAIKIGDGSEVLDSAQLIADPGHQYTAPQLLIGNNVTISEGAKVLGPSVIGSYSDSSAIVSIGPNAVIDDATIEPGAIVSGLATVGPGVTVPSGYRVLPGVDVTTDAQATNPSLGMVVKVTSSDTTSARQILADGVALAAGYTSLYQGGSATGTNIGGNPEIGGIYNGYLPGVEGVSESPGPSYVGNSKKTSPKFLTPHQGLVGVQLDNFPGRVIGQATFTYMRSGQLAGRLGRANSIRADEGGTITIGSIAETGPHVSIGSPVGGTLAIGQDFRAAKNAVILGGVGVNMKIGDQVTIGAGSVINTTSLGTGSTVGADAYLMGSTFPADTHIPAGAIYVNNVFQGYVQGTPEGG